VRAAHELAHAGADEAGGGNPLSRRARRAAQPFRRPQHAIDQVLVEAVVEVNDEARAGLSAHAAQADERLAEMAATVERLEHEVLRLARAQEEQASRGEERVAALEAALALLAERLGDDGDGA
jgi:ABC-type nitrate/sulfonate/bicarbonate transport system substrate-binding protein